MTNEETLRFLILGAQREGNRTFAALLAPHDITPSQAEALRCLSGEHTLSLGELGQRLVCETGSPSRLVSGLVDRGWVRRTEDPRDRRSVVLSLTSDGAAIEAIVRDAEQQLYRWIASRLGSEELSSACSILGKLIEDTVSGNAVAARSGASV